MAWYQVKGNDADTVFSSRIRFARNLSGYRFDKGLSAEQSNEIIDRVGAALGEEYIKTDMAALPAIKAASLVEQHIVSRDLPPRKRLTPCSATTTRAFR